MSSPQSARGADTPDPSRLAMFQSVLRPSELADVAAAVSEATQEHSEFYVERVGDLWRWSPVHKGAAIRCCG